MSIRKLIVSSLILLLLISNISPVFAQTSATSTTQTQVNVNLPKGDELTDEELEKVEGQLYVYDSDRSMMSGTVINPPISSGGRSIIAESIFKGIVMVGMKQVANYLTTGEFLSFEESMRDFITIVGGSFILSLFGL